jgi:hypothetical protein
MTAARKSWRDGLRAIDTPVLAYGYSLLLVLMVLAVNFVSLLLSLVATRRWLRAAKTHNSLFHRLTLLLGIVVISTAFGILVLAVLGLFFNPAMWALVIISRHISPGWIIVGLIAADVFALWMQGAWLRALLATSLLPGLLLIFLTCEDLGRDLLRWAKHEGKSALVTRLAQAESKLLPIAAAMLVGIFLYGILELFL